MVMHFWKLFILVLLTMIAFAANSVLTRLAISNNQLGPASFSFFRLLSGSIVLIIIVFIRSGLLCIWESKPNMASILGLSFYMVGFHFAYNSLNAGLGAIVLFGGVQLVMFTSTILSKEKTSFYNWAGMLLAMLGILILFFPKDLVIADQVYGLLLMLLASLGWGIYSLSGRRSKDPIASTMSNFIFTIPTVSLVLLFYPDSISLSHNGVLLAICSGAIMSALGYSLWYAILPFLEKPVASLVQLVVPVIALILGIIILDEKLTYLSFFSSLLIIGGISFGIFSDGFKKRFKE